MITLKMEPSKYDGVWKPRPHWPGGPPRPRRSPRSPTGWPSRARRRASRRRARRHTRLHVVRRRRGDRRRGNEEEAVHYSVGGGRRRNVVRRLLGRGRVPWVLRELLRAKGGGAARGASSGVSRAKGGDGRSACGRGGVCTEEGDSEGRDAVSPRTETRIFGTTLTTADAVPPMDILESSDDEMMLLRRQRQRRRLRRRRRCRW